MSEDQEQAQAQDADDEEALELEEPEGEELGSDVDGDGDGRSHDDGPSVDALLHFLHRSRGFDFTGYKRGSLTRRIRRRMQAVGIDDYATYLDYLQVHPDEFPQLFNLLLINVTAFFRDPAAWAALAKRLPTIIDLQGSTPIRVWSAGCSSGEEPYTIAMILAEMLGTPEAYARRVKIYATDIDEDALAHARQASYSIKALEPVEPALVEKYFTRVGSSYVFNKELRRTVIFGRHDLVQDAPIPRVDLLTCRNALMYFNADAQTRILERLQFALNPTGILFLGKAEMLLTHADLFSPIDLKLRLFVRAAKTMRAERHPSSGGGHHAGHTNDGSHDPRKELAQAALDASPLAQIVIDANGRMVLANHRATHLFGLSVVDIGRPFHELQLSYRPAELRSCIDKVRLERRPLQLNAVERLLKAGDKSFLDIDILPLVSDKGAFLGSQVSFTDVTDMHRLQTELRRSNADLETAHEELQSTSEELETTNEELQSTVEELETTNEELQSTNEELETMNEELQSTNEELQTINEELRQRSTELHDMNEFFGSVLGSLRIGVAVLNGELQVRTWNAKMEDLWGVRAAEVQDKQFITLDIGLPIEQLTTSLRTCLVGGEASEHVIQCTNRRGKTMTCKVSALPLRSGNEHDDEKGVIVLVEEVV